MFPDRDASSQPPLSFSNHLSLWLLVPPFLEPAPVDVTSREHNRPRITSPFVLWGNITDKERQEKRYNFDREIEDIFLGLKFLRTFIKTLVQHRSSSDGIDDILPWLREAKDKLKSCYNSYIEGVNTRCRSRSVDLFKRGGSERPRRRDPIPRFRHRSNKNITTERPTTRSQRR
jgi:hypothetical protein